MELDINKIKELREATGLSFAQIKKALLNAAGDIGQALKFLAEQGASIAAKKASRSTQEGKIEAYVHATRKTAVLVEVLCETDFVARNPLFDQLSHDVAMHIAAMDPQDKEELLGQSFVKDQDITVEDLINQYIAKLGENIQVGRFTRYTI